MSKSDAELMDAWRRTRVIKGAGPGTECADAEIARLRVEVERLSRPATWQDEAAAVEAAFESSGVQPTWPNDEPGSIGPMAAAMASEIVRLREEAERLRAAATLTDTERYVLRELRDIHAALGVPRGDGIAFAIDGLIARLGGGE